MSQAETITKLIEARPGIRTAEIADELEIEMELVRPCIQPRIANSRIIVDKVPGPNGMLINAYRVNPKWTPADAKFTPKPAASTDEGEKNPLPIRQTVTAAPAQWVASAAKKAAAKKSPGKKKRSPVTTTRKTASNKASSTNSPVSERQLSTTQKVEESPAPAPGVAPDLFACAVYHDGRGEIRTAAGNLVLTPGQVAIVARHFARFPQEVAK